MTTKIAITAAGPSLDSQVDPRFGRCPHFLLVDTETEALEALANPSADTPGGGFGGGAGIRSAQLMASRGVSCVLTGNCGPGAHEALTAAGIEILVGCMGTAREALARYRAGQLEPGRATGFGRGGGGRRGRGGGFGRGGRW